MAFLAVCGVQRQNIAMTSKSSFQAGLLEKSTQETWRKQSLSSSSAGVGHGFLLVGRLRDVVCTYIAPWNLPVWRSGRRSGETKERGYQAGL